MVIVDQINSQTLPESQDNHIAAPPPGELHPVRSCPMAQLAYTLSASHRMSAFAYKRPVKSGSNHSSKGRQSAEPV